MKRQIRINTWETNSSSQHTLTIMTEEEYRQYWKDSCNPDMYWDRNNEKYVSANKLINAYNKLVDNDNNRTYEEKIKYMMDICGYYNDDEDCSETVVKEIKMSDGIKQYAISRYTWEN